MSHKTVRGFTLIELMLSMTFIAVMLIAIALCVIQMSTIYTRGETLRQVNQASRVISTDIEDTIAGSYPFTASQAIANAGRLCTGQYSYVWNTPTTNNVYQSASDGIIRFVRVTDPGGALCVNLATPVVKANSTELLETGDRTLTIHSFRIDQASESAATGQRLYTITILLGTNNTSVINTTANDVRCRDTGGTDTDLTYCAVNKFTITVRAGIG